MTQESLTTISLVCLFLIAASTHLNAAGFESNLKDPVVVRPTLNINDSCVPGSQSGKAIDTRNWIGKLGIKIQKDGYQFWVEKSSTGYNHWYEYDDCRLVKIPVTVNEQTPVYTKITPDPITPGPITPGPTTDSNTPDTSPPGSVPGSPNDPYLTGEYEWPAAPHVCSAVDSAGMSLCPP